MTEVMGFLLFLHKRMLIHRMLRFIFLKIPNKLSFSKHLRCYG